MILMLTIGLLPNAVAGNLDPHGAKPGQLVSVLASAPSSLNSCDHDTINYCQDRPVCLSQCSYVALPGSNLFELSIPALVLVADPDSKVALSTRYPGLLKRPPES
jgi:hypothetical protein